MRLVGSTWNNGGASLASRAVTVCSWERGRALCRARPTPRLGRTLSRSRAGPVHVEALRRGPPCAPKQRSTGDQAEKRLDRAPIGLGHTDFASRHLHGETTRPPYTTTTTTDSGATLVCLKPVGALDRANGAARAPVAGRERATSAPRSSGRRTDARLGTAVIGGVGGAQALAAPGEDGRSRFSAPRNEVGGSPGFWVAPAAHGGAKAEARFGTEFPCAVRIGRAFVGPHSYEPCRLTAPGVQLEPGAREYVGFAKEGRRRVGRCSTRRPGLKARRESHRRNRRGANRAPCRFDVEGPTLHGRARGDADWGGPTKG